MTSKTGPISQFSTYAEQNKIHWENQICLPSIWFFFSFWILLSSAFIQGNKTISNLLSILKEIGYRSFYVKTGLIYRDSILQSKLLLNSDVWHGRTLQQVSVLEEVNRTYLRTILSSNSKVPIEYLNFETGTMPLKYDLMKSRLMYLLKILHVEETELISRLYNSQILYKTKTKKLNTFNDLIENVWNVPKKCPGSLN